jgi:hypothetical protein
LISEKSSVHGTRQIQSATRCIHQNLTSAAFNGKA